MMKKTKTSVILIILALLTGLPLTALTVDQAVAQGLKSNLGLQRSGLDLTASQRQANLGWTGLVPDLAVGVGSSATNTALASAGTDNWTSNASLKVSATLASSAFANIETTRLAYASGKITYELAARDLELSIRKAFYGLLLDQESIALAQANRERAQLSYDDAKTRFLAGRISELELLTAQLDLEKLSPDLESARNALQDGLASFRLLLGLDPSLDLTVEGSLVLPDATAASGENLSPDISHNVKILALATQLEQAQAAKTADQLALWLPSLSLAWSWQPTAQGTSSAVDTGGLSAQVSLNLGDLLPWSGKQEAIRSAADKISSLQSQLTETRQNLVATVQSALRSVSLARRNLQVRILNAELSTKTWQLAKESWEKGLRDLASVQTAETDMKTAANQVLTQRYQLVISLLDLEYTLGLPLGSTGA